MKFEIEIPASLVPYMEHEEFKAQQTALLLYPYIAHGDMSNGKAAELLGMSKTELLDMFGEMGIPYFTQTAEELDSDIQTLRSLRE